MTLSLAEKTEKLREVKEDLLRDKTLPLYEYRQANHYWPVVGEGSHNAKIIFIGEAPGKNEAEKGRPFCGAAGKILDELLFSIGLKREEVYITNIVKDRPPENRDPLPNEIESYAPFLDRQLEILEPKVIATLGRFSMKYLMEKMKLDNALKAISQIHGQVFEAEASYGEVKVIPLYHPAVAIYSRATKETLIKDFQILKKYA